MNSCSFRTHFECSCEDRCKAVPAPVPNIVIKREPPFSKPDRLPAAVAAFLTIFFTLFGGAIYLDKHFAGQDLVQQEGTSRG